jgi:hypothetical protein
MGRFFVFCLLAALLSAGESRAQTVTMLVAPFDSLHTGSSEIGKKIGIILNLQIWNSLVVPSSGPGRNTLGRLRWDVYSPPPTNAKEAERLALDYIENPQIVLWGRGWQYGTGYVVEAFLSIRSSASPRQLGFDLWSISFGSETSFSVDYPRSQTDFSPILLRSDLLPDLRDPSGLKLYVDANGRDTNGYVGHSFTAKERRLDTTKVKLLDGREGWIRLPNLSRERSEVVDFASGLIRILRQDWPNARKSFERVLSSARTPTMVRVDSNLYLAVIAYHLREDPLPFVREAYKLDPYSKTNVQYLCMAHLAMIERMNATQRSGPMGAQALRDLMSIVDHHRTLFAKEDAWLNALRAFLTRASTN